MITVEYFCITIGRCYFRQRALIAALCEEILRGELLFLVALLSTVELWWEGWVWFWGAADEGCRVSVACGVVSCSEKGSFLVLLMLPMVLLLCTIVIIAVNCSSLSLLFGHLPSWCCGFVDFIINLFFRNYLVIDLRLIEDQIFTDTKRTLTLMRYRGRRSWLILGTLTSGEIRWNYSCASFAHSSTCLIFISEPIVILIIWVCTVLPVIILFFFRLRIAQNM